MKDSKWYDNKFLVVILCILFFPVGLYALWKSSSFSRTSKLIGTALVGLLVVTAVNRKPKIQNVTPETASVEDSQDRKGTDKAEKKSDGLQKAFCDAKLSEFAKQVNMSKEEIEVTQREMSLEILKEQQMRITNWEVALIDFDTFSDERADISFSVYNRVKSGTQVLNGRQINRTATLEILQANSEKRGYNGIERDSELFIIAKSLREGQKCLISGVVVDAIEGIEKTGLNLSSTLQIELSSITPL